MCKHEHCLAVGLNFIDNVQVSEPRYTMLDTLETPATTALSQSWITKPTMI